MPADLPSALFRSLPLWSLRSLSKQALWRRLSSLRTEYDAVVVGGGVAGAAAAFELAKRGQRVALLEQFDLLHAHGSSHGESRVIRRTYTLPHFTGAMPAAYALWAAAEEEFRGEPVFTRTGGLDIGRQDDPELLRLLAACKEHGVPHELLSPAEVAVRFPAFALPAGYVGVFQRDAGVLRATQAVAMFHELARRRGAHVRGSTKVTALQPTPHGVTLQTSRGPLHARKVVLCAGAWTAKLLQPLGIHASSALQPLAVAVSYWRARDAASAAHFAAARCPVSLSYDASGAFAECYLIPETAGTRHPGCVKVSLHLPVHLWGTPLSDPDAPGDPSAALAAVVERHVAPFVRQFLPGLDASAPIVEPCLYTMTRDESFLIDSVHPNIVAVSACSGHGFKFGPLTGAAAADMLLEGRTDRFGEAALSLASKLPQAKL